MPRAKRVLTLRQRILTFSVRMLTVRSHVDVITAYAATSCARCEAALRLRGLSLRASCAQVFDLINGMGIAKNDMNGNAKALAKYAELNPGMSLQVRE